MHREMQRDAERCQMMWKVPFQVSSSIKAAANKALQKCRKYVDPTLKHATRRI
jgi:hypothetical protein